MSLKIMTLVWSNFPRGGSDKLIMLAMADWCNDEGGSLYPSIPTVAKRANLSEKQARVIVHRLISDGYLSVVGNQNGGNPQQSRQYILVVDKLLTPPVSVSPTTPMEVTPNLEVTPPVEVTRTPPMERIYPSRGGSLPLPPTGGNPPITTRKATVNITTKRILPDWLPESSIKDFIDNRKALRSPMTEKAISMLVAELIKIHDAGHDAIESLNVSILNGWKSVYPPKNQLSNADKRKADNLAALDAWANGGNQPIEGESHVIE